MRFKTGLDIEVVCGLMCRWAVEWRAESSLKPLSHPQYVRGTEMTTFKESDIAFVTGAGSGIGRATCRLLAERGATVVAADINKPAADETINTLTGKKHLSILLDVTRKDDVTTAIEVVTRTYGRPPNIAVNCAALCVFSPLLEVTEELHHTMFNVNLKGTVWVNQAVCKALVDTNRKGSIVNIASDARRGLPCLSIYSATKAAVNAFTISAAREFGPKGIRINSVCPGIIETPMSNSFVEEVLQDYRDRSALQRIGTPEEVAEVISFLSSEQSSFVTGTAVTVNGGHP